MNSITANYQDNASHKWLFCQLVALFLGLSFAGGGGMAGQGVGVALYLKAVFLTLPLLGIFLLAVKDLSSLWQAWKTYFWCIFWLWFYFVFAVLSLIWAYDRGYSLGRFIVMLYSFLSLSCVLLQYLALQYKYQAVSYITSMTFRRHVLYLGVFLPLILFVVIGISGPAVTFSHFRLAMLPIAVYIHPNVLSSITAYLFLNALFFRRGHSVLKVYERDYRIIPILRLMIILFALLLLVLIMTRTVLFAVGVGALITLYVSAIRMPERWSVYNAILVALTFGAVGLMVQLNIISPQDLLGLVARGQNIEDMMTLTNRTVLWQQLMARTTPMQILFGNGYGVMIPGFAVDFGTGMLYGAHNTYLSMLLSTGILSLAMYLCFLLRQWSNLILRWSAYPIRLRQFFLIMLIFYMINGLASNEFSIALTTPFALFVSFCAIELRKPPTS